MEIPRQFTRNLSDPYEGLDFAERTSKITNADGSVVSEINEVLVEAGPLLNGALLAAKLVDELLVYQASHVMGDDARGMFTIPGLANMNQRIQLERKDLRMVGDDLRLLFSVSGQDDQG